MNIHELPAILEAIESESLRASAQHEVVDRTTCRTLHSVRFLGNLGINSGNRDTRMGGGYRLVILFLLSITGTHRIDGAALNPFPLGTIGCLIADVCDTGEICTNDLLFGSCQSKFSRILNGENKFELDTPEIKEMERKIRGLIKGGFTWKDAYTQCVLQNSLLDFMKGRSFDRYLCEDALGVASPDWSDDVKDEIADVLLQLLNSQDVPLNDADAADSIGPQDTGLALLNSNKRDEIVKVHKYFDKSKGLLKRDPYFVGQGMSYPVLYPNGRLNPIGLNYAYSKDAYQDDDDSYDKSYPEQERFVQEYEEPDIDLDTLKQLHEDRILSQYMQDLEEAQSPSLEADMIPQESQMDEQDTPEDEYNAMLDNLVLSKGDQAALQGLAEGTLYKEDLEPGQLGRLRVFFQTLIQLIQAEEQESDPQIDDDSDIPEDVIENQEMIENFPESDPMDNVSSDEGYDIMSDPDMTPDLMSETGLRESEPELLEGEPELLEEALQTGELPVDKKMSDDEEENTIDSADKSLEEVFDRNTMYMELSRKATEEEARLFVNNITSLLGLPRGMIEYRLSFPANNIMLKVEDDPQEVWDVRSIGAAAESHNDDLLNRTSIAILKYGPGEPPFFQAQAPVEATKQNNRYVVLTFILVGTIAGVVLAVVTIYLIKRHHRSKQKLANLAANTDGNEASKDYQDLCRQRMQGKSNEKPEPLHAASRIGSVSENQVRSPSSRSSTSSWSEEPAATNMDISTGHIVLSYMEDHLKNQDRLDKEWEAVSGYVADPSSTKIAADPCNTRKSRYADILPYDHSRVVLSSSANVANSDFINASFITDHDPRNPAYICTQGPLPHTVADFWQMIWEQGSVVIVMLTKLSENGTNLCHRYWPEEGSDLYHIYEVHLVSEHIWCDDYLVRSFYLKNLQTNETRTVTQFHFLTWPQLSVPASIKALLDFRRKVNKSFRGRSCPIVVHCSDGCGRSGTYCLIDMVLNKMAKGAKEIDMAATLEHIRDQRMSMVTTKEQFQFSLAAVAEEVHAILKALPQ